MLWTIFLQPYVHHLWQHDNRQNWLLYELKTICHLHNTRVHWRLLVEFYKIFFDSILKQRCVVTFFDFVLWNLLWRMVYFLNDVKKHRQFLVKIILQWNSSTFSLFFAVKTQEIKILFRIYYFLVTLFSPCFSPANYLVCLCLNFQILPLGGGSNTTTKNQSALFWKVMVLKIGNIIMLEIKSKKVCTDCTSPSGFRKRK